MGQPQRLLPLLRRKAKGEARGQENPALPLPEKVGKEAARAGTRRVRLEAPVLFATSIRKPDAVPGKGVSTPARRGPKAREAIRAAQALDVDAVRPREVEGTEKGADRSQQGRESRARPSPASSSHLETASRAHNARFNMARLPPQQSGERTEVGPLHDPTRKRRKRVPLPGGPAAHLRLGLPVLLVGAENPERPLRV